MECHSPQEMLYMELGVSLKNNKGIVLLLNNHTINWQYSPKSIAMMSALYEKNDTLTIEMSSMNELSFSTPQVITSPSFDSLSNTIKAQSYYGKGLKIRRTTQLQLCVYGVTKPYNYIEFRGAWKVVDKEGLHIIGFNSFVEKRCK